MTVERCGIVAIVGRPNVGKSTLLNHLLGQKISITSRKPQTTRHRILGVDTRGNDQLVFVDTPGLHRDNGRALNRFMNRSALGSMGDVDIIVMVLDRLEWGEEDEAIAERALQRGVPVILVVNKVDKLESKAVLLPFLEDTAKRYEFSAIVPLSALRSQNLDSLVGELRSRLPEAAHLFPPDQVTDRSERFLVAEIVREKLIRQLGEELPYSNTVQIEEFRDEGTIVHISALIVVEKDGQKAIVIGKGGSRLKKIGEEARADIERLIDTKVMLKLWVKVRSGWADDERALRSLGYVDDKQG